MEEGAAAPEVSVVVATYERPERLARLFSAVAAQTVNSGRFELIVVDDGSGPETAAAIASLVAGAPFPCRLLASELNGGPATARNVGWRSATAPLVAFTDDDCEPAPGWLEALLTAAAAGAEMVQGVTLPNPREAQDLGPFSRTLQVESLGPWFPTCNIAYTRGLLERLDGFDESFRPAAEDTDLAWRALAAGAEPVFASEALVHHAVGVLGPLGRLRVAWRWAPAVRVFRAHPALRAHLILGLFWKRSHALLLLLLVGFALRRRWAPALLLALPYVREVRGRMAAENAPPAVAPYYAVHDAVEVAAMVRGGVSARVPIL